ncbi:hypothetical protein BDY19DRAFT_971275 [Irpex rosettiformis]|uniref:Uncharacterized protein n=1 Tax=Irpex rosettiformis TaxID=378272 RepID=A0ACB8TR28_9APHY|nr:hypothetical protein BDY19DRAFT_971275 [Irpex rosettiformis]
MLTPPSSTASPSLTPTDAPTSRKRQRSLSTHTESSSTSAKRSMSADPNQLDLHETPRSKDLSALTINDPTNADDIDAYMAEQGDASGEATVSSVDAPAVALSNDSVASARGMQPSPSSSPAEKLEYIRQICAIPLKPGDTWYLVSRRWYRRWEKACTGEEDKDGPVQEKDLGPVDNSPLFDAHENILSTLTEHFDVEYVPEDAWEAFVEWYGTPSKTLPRKVITRGILQETTIELHPPRFYTHVLLRTKSDNVLPPGGTTCEVVLSSKNTVSDLQKAIVAAHFPNNATNLEYRIWKLEDSHTGGEMHITVDDLIRIGATVLEESQSALDDALIDNGDSFVIELQSNGLWLVDAGLVPAKPGEATSQPPPDINAPQPLFSPNSDFFSQMQQKSTPTSSTGSSGTVVPSQATLQPSALIKPVASKDSRLLKTNALQPGILGLSNMGNTCFMNSAIQCLAHTKELVDYFLTGVFGQELNVDNPLGMGGAIAEAFGQLLRKIWAPTTSNSSYSPREFKQVLQRFAPQFSGYQQHDSQELVAFLLDGLHEDLNRVLKKPYVEKPDWEGGGDKELIQLAQTSWDGYMKRNDSVIVDLFQGQYQSTLVCPECDKVSITFDPYMYLTLPLPVNKKWQHSIYYVPWDIEKPHLEIPIELNGQSTFKDVRALLGRWMGTNPDHLATLEVFGHRFYKNLDDTVMVTDMGDSDIIACYELPCHSQQTRSYKKQEGDPFILSVSLLENRSSQRYNSTQHFGYPFLIVVTPEQATDLDSVYDLVVERLQKWTTNVRDLHSWEMGRMPSPKEMTLIPLGLRVEATSAFQDDDDVVALEEPVPEESDITDQKSVETEQDDDPSEELYRVGFKKDLFNLHIHPGATQYGAGYGTTTVPRMETWDQRIDRLREEDSPVLLQDGDSIVCEFDENVRAYYFGEEARWGHWERFIHPELAASHEATTHQKKRGITLQDCLDEFTKEEQLGEDDLWYCPNCKKHQQAIKRFDLWSVPDVLVVHLKRFSNNRTLRDKIDTLVDFPLEGLDLTSMIGERKVAQRLTEKGEDIYSLGLKDVDEPLIYDLYAVDEHLGGLGGGHYRAYAHNDLDDKWYHFDDSYVTPSQASSSINSNAYLLFYKRRTPRPLGGKSHEKVEAAKKLTETSEVEEADHSMDTTANVDSQLPTPPAEISNNLPFGDPTTFVLDSMSDSWQMTQYNPPSSNTRSSPASSSGVSDDASPPAFENAVHDLLMESNWDPGETIELNFPDPTSNGSPSSVNAEFDQDDLDTDVSEDSSNKYRLSPHVDEDDEMPELESVETFSQTTRIPILVTTDHGLPTPPVGDINKVGHHTDMDI